MPIYLKGLVLGLSLIITLGPQNLFLIKQGARGHHAGLSALVCFICDIILVTASVAGLHEILLLHPGLKIVMVWLGAAFLLFYAFKALYSALFTKKQDRQMSHSSPHTRMQIIIMALGFSLLNPHAIIDTLVIIGSNSSQFPDHELTFLLGVLTSSLIWFSSLTFTTRYMSSVLTRATVWKMIELLSGLLMAYIGINLVLTGFE